MKKVILEQSTNTHTLSANKVSTNILKGEVGGLALKIVGKGVVTHGEHNTLVTESANVIKINQQEFNPITKKMENARD